MILRHFAFAAAIYAGAMALYLVVAAFAFGGDPTSGAALATACAALGMAAR